MAPSCAQDSSCNFQFTVTTVGVGPGWKKKTSTRTSTLGLIPQDGQWRDGPETDAEDGAVNPIVDVNCGFQNDRIYEIYNDSGGYDSAGIQLKCNKCVLVIG